jgi:hypothetical protein
MRHFYLTFFVAVVAACFAFEAVPWRSLEHSDDAGYDQMDVMALGETSPAAE